MFTAEFIVFAIGLLGAFVRAFTGFGHMLVALACWSVLNFFGIPTLPRLKQIFVCNFFAVVPAGIVFMILTNACDNANMGFTILLIVFYNIGATIGAYLTKKLKQQMLMIIVGFMLIVVAIILNFLQPIQKFIKSKTQKKEQNQNNQEKNNSSQNVSEIIVGENSCNDNFEFIDEINSNQENDVQQNQNCCDNYQKNVDIVFNDQNINRSNETDQSIYMHDDSVTNTSDDNNSKKDTFLSKICQIQKVFLLSKKTQSAVAKFFKVIWYILRGNVKYEKIIGDERLNLQFEFRNISNIKNTQKNSIQNSSSSSSDDNDDDDEQQQSSQKIVEWKINTENLNNQEILYIQDQDELNIPLIQNSKIQNNQNLNPQKNRFSDKLHVTITSGFYKALKYIILASVLAGFLGTFMGLAGPPIMIMIQALDINRKESLAAISVLSFFNFSIVDYILSGIFKKQEILLYIFFTVGQMLGLFFGTMAGKNLSQIWFKRIMSILVVVAAVVQICQGFKIIPKP